MNQRSPILACLLAATLVLAAGCDNVNHRPDPGGPVYAFDPPVLDPVTTPTNTTAALITGQAAPGATVEVTGTTTGTATADSAGRFSVAVTLQMTAGADTTNTLAVQYLLGSDESAFAVAVIVHDGTAPAPPTLTPVTSPTSLDTISLGGTTEPNATLAVTGALAGVSAAADETGAFSAAVDLKPNQSNLISVTATDLAGNTSAASTLTVVHDDIAPQTPVADRLSAYFDGSDVRVSGAYQSVEAGVTVTLLNLTTAASATVTANSNGSFAGTIAGGGAGQQVRVTTADGAGNASPGPDPVVPVSLDWTEVADGTAPSQRYGGTLTLDMRNNRAILFGGRDGSGAVSDTCWSLDLTPGSEGWTQITAGGGPGPRWGHSACFDPNNQIVVIFGGEDGGYLDDIYALDVSTPGSESWSTLTPSGTAPAARSYHTAVYSEFSRDVMIYGGRDGTTTYADVVACRLDPLATPQWVAMPSNGSPPAGRYGHAACVDNLKARMVIFGGINEGGAYTQDLYSYTLTVSAYWSAVTSTGTLPSARARHAMVLDGVENRLILFGGDTGTQRVGDTHFFYLNTDTWGSPEPTGNPTAREEPQAVFDLTHLRPLFFGGTSGGSGGTLFADLWQLD